MIFIKLDKHWREEDVVEELVKAGAGQIIAKYGGGKIDFSGSYYFSPLENKSPPEQLQSPAEN